jgi:hypothetical protein
VASSRQTLKPAKNPPKVFRRHGKPSKVEKEFVAQFVQDQPAEITPKQVSALARTMRRSREVIRGMIDDAKENFVSNAERYVEIHKEAVEEALAGGTVAGLEAAIKGSQWAMENLSAEGARIVDGNKNSGGNGGGTKIMIGVNLGGLNKNRDESVTAVATEVIDE